MTETQYAALLREAVPDGTYGETDHSPWTRAEQDKHYADLCEAIGAPNDRATKPNPRRRNRSQP
ncbi:hypothetical protein [Streptomyces sp. 8L]|uniref:hypothetical protein n=1 Tax=Streptomyces sp. 8L TaxID=2877242 RepID=UPI001CD22037|nr:hypothetical protein [Streptomyces sp. 8L]MCA1224120.1 hypothetical protein [Streptomyces sp. 8L]